MRACGIGAVAVVLASFLLTGCGSSAAAQAPAAVPVHHVDDAAGRSSQKVVPRPGELSTPTVPPCCSTILRVMASPSPAPPPRQPPTPPVAKLGWMARGPLGTA